MSTRPTAFQLLSHRLTSELLVLPAAGKVLVYPIKEGSQVELLAIDGKGASIASCLRGCEQGSTHAHPSEQPVSWHCSRDRWTLTSKPLSLSLRFNLKSPSP